MEKVAIFGLLLLGYLPSSQSYSSGAPQKACSDMFPNHGVDSQMSEAPYSITIGPDSKYPGGNVTVTIQSTSDKVFAGFFLQARKASCRISEFEMPIGTFFTNDPEVKLISCTGNYPNNSVTHSSGAMKYVKQFLWMNPEGGDVFFQATFVHEFQTLWAGVKSNVLKDPMMTSHHHSNCPSRTKEDMYPRISSSSSLFQNYNAFLIVLSLIPFTTRL